MKTNRKWFVFLFFQLGRGDRDGGAELLDGDGMVMLKSVFALNSSTHRSSSNLLTTDSEGTCDVPILFFQLQAHSHQANKNLIQSLWFRFLGCSIVLA